MLSEPISINIAIKCADGTVAIMGFLVRARGNVLPSGATWMSKDYGIWTRAPTTEAVEEEISKALPAGTAVSWRFIEPGDVPQDRTYRDALVDSGSKLEYDLAKARDIHRGFLRAARTPRMATLDVAFMKALETNNTVKIAEIAAEKDELRDVTVDPRIDAAKTVEELKPLTLATLVPEAPPIGGLGTRAPEGTMGGSTPTSGSMPTG